tara:strand:- start:63 stop:773 length:711 start_codon:yes stop_codon:yes gene_type:complete
MLKFIIAACISVASAERATLVVRKDLDTAGLTSLVEGQNFSVTYTLTNVGDAAATEVKVTDNFDGDDYDVMEGSKTFKLETLAAGASATHTYVMQPTTSDAAVVRRRAKVMYSYAAADGETKTIKAFSSSAFGEALKIVSKEQHKKDTSLYVVRCVACDRRLARQRCAVDPYAPSCVTRPPPAMRPAFATPRVLTHPPLALTPARNPHRRSGLPSLRSRSVPFCFRSLFSSPARRE